MNLIFLIEIQQLMTRACRGSLTNPTNDLFGFRYRTFVKINNQFLPVGGLLKTLLHGWSEIKPLNAKDLSFFYKLFNARNFKETSNGRIETGLNFCKIIFIWSPWLSTLISSIYKSIYLFNTITVAFGMMMYLISPL